MFLSMRGVPVMNSRRPTPVAFSARDASYLHMQTFHQPLKTLVILLATLTLAVAGDYPLNTCVVSGEKLGEMGKPYIFNYQGTEVRLCCDGCRAKFDKDPAKYLGKITEATKAAK